MQRPTRHRLFAAALSVSALFAVVPIRPAVAKPTPERRCALAKLKAAAKVTSSLLNCHSKGAKKGKDVAAACTGKATHKVKQAFTKAEKRACFSQGEVFRVAVELRRFADTIAAAVRPPVVRSPCAAAKLKAAGKRAAMQLTALAKNAKKPSADKLTRSTAKARAKLTRTFEKLAATGRCSPSDHADMVEKEVLRLLGGALTQLNGCSDVPAEEFERAGTGRWASTLAHAQSLGFVGIVEAELCPPKTDDIQHASARLVNPDAAAPNNEIYLSASHPYALPFLVKRDETDAVSIFNENGGVRVLADGTVEVVGADGVTEWTAATSPTIGAANNLNCPLEMLHFLACVVNEVLPFAECAAALFVDISVFKRPTVISGTVCVDAFSGRTGAPAKLFTCDSPNGFSCNRDTKCSRIDECNWGFCQPIVPDNEGSDCTEEKPHYPVCGAPDRPFFWAVRCSGGQCAARLQQCQTGEVCTGLSGSAHCVPRTTTTTLPGGCEFFRCNDGGCATVVCDGITECADGSDEDPTMCAVAGAWTGSYFVNGPGLCTGESGAWSASFVVDGGTLSGTWQSAFGPSGTLSGSVDGGDVSFAVGGGGGVSFQGTVSGSSISGTFSGPECPDQSGIATGTFTGSKVGG